MCLIGGRLRGPRVNRLGRRSLQRQEYRGQELADVGLGDDANLVDKAKLGQKAGTNLRLVDCANLDVLAGSFRDVAAVSGEERATGEVNTASGFWLVLHETPHKYRIGTL